MEQRLTMVTLGVADLERSRRFYEQGLGWRVASPTSEDIVFIQTGGVVLALYPERLLAEDVQVTDWPRTGFRGVALAHNARSKEAVDAALARAEAAGERILKPAREVFWGGYSGYFADPDGHAWEVAWNPHWELDGEGLVRLS